MFLRATIRKKDGKLHRYFSVVENRRVRGGRVVQRHVLYLGEINSSQELAWRKSIEVLDEAHKAPRTLALFPEDRYEVAVDDESVVRLKLSGLRLERPRQWGGCWLALQLWRQLALDEFWAEWLAPSRKGTRWDEVLLILVVYRLLSPGSEWRLHRQWFGRSALPDLLGTHSGVVVTARTRENWCATREVCAGRDRGGNHDDNVPPARDGNGPHRWRMGLYYR